MVPLTSINYNSNQHRESFPYKLKQYPTQLLQRDGVVVMVLVEMMVWMMMIPMKPSLTMVLMATVPLFGKEFPRQKSVCRRDLFLSVFSAP